MRIYISGPMTGYPNLNRNAFYAKERQLRVLGYKDIRNPAIIEKLVGSGKDYADYLRLAVNWLITCDILVYVDNVKLSSRGCYAETLLAESLKMPICFCKDDGLYKAVRDRAILTCGDKIDPPLFKRRL
ncbi:MAG: DUF4406 domain-containing protein [Elusimicrobiota bacterium]|jgi:hypothetical protein|nr:DUF4406 domain-containing protein [Elusimicrobiota bacterium]